MISTRSRTFYAERGCPVQIELCPLASPDLPARLIEARLRPAGVRERARPAWRRPSLCRPRLMPISRSKWAAAEHPWLEIVAEGFSAPDRSCRGSPPVPHDAVAAIGDVMRVLRHPEIVRYVAHVDGQPASAAVSFVKDGVLCIAGTATRQAFRRRGLQRAVVARALNDGARQGRLDHRDH